MEFPIPYLPSLGWYRAFVAYRLGIREECPKLPRHFCRAEVVAPFGRRCLSVPVEGGRKLITQRRYPSLALSEHGDWRHTHWSTIASAYGSTPYFHLYEADFEKIFQTRHEMLWQLCEILHHTIDHAISLSQNIEWILNHPEAKIITSPSGDDDESLSIIDTLFKRGPATLFSLLPQMTGNDSF